jgi:hypothetical protein
VVSFAAVTKRRTFEIFAIAIGLVGLGFRIDTRRPHCSNLCGDAYSSTDFGVHIAVCPPIPSLL